MIDLVAANHTNRELELRLKGSKPLAMFYAYTSDLPDERLIPEEAFLTHINNGTFIRDAIVFDEYAQHTKCNVKLKYVFFALPEEAWRIKAMILIKQSFKKTLKWNPTLERIECSLLGYTDAEVDAWCNKAALNKSKSNETGAENANTKSA